MKKNRISIFIIILFYFVNFSVFTQSDKKIKRKILILPFINKNKVIEYDYLSSVIMETLRSELIETDIYDFTNYSISDNKFKQYNQEDFLSLENAKEIARDLNANVVISGQYIIFDKKIMVLIHVIDVFSGELVALTKEEGRTGIGLFNVINRASTDVVEKITKQLPMMDKKEYDLKIQKKITFVLTPLKKTGIGLITAGGCLQIIGLSILIYDIAGYSQILRTYRQNYLDTNEDYLEYDKSYNVFVGLLISSVCITGAGIIMGIIGIPLLLVNFKENKKRNISFLVDFGNIDSSNYNSKIYFSMRIKL